MQQIGDKPGRKRPMPFGVHCAFVGRRLRAKRQFKPRQSPTPFKMAPICAVWTRDRTKRRAEEAKILKTAPRLGCKRAYRRLASTSLDDICAQRRRRRLASRAYFFNQVSAATVAAAAFDAAAVDTRRCRGRARQERVSSLATRSGRRQLTCARARRSLARF